MKSYYSIIKYVNNSLTNETISLGLIVLSSNEIFSHLSPSKIDLAKKLNSKNFKLLDFSLKQFNQLIDKTLNRELSPASEQKTEIIDYNYLLRLSNYNNGILQFSKPELIDSIITYDTFLLFLKRFIGEDLNEIAIEAKPSLSPFKDLIKQKLYQPLENRIDVNFTLKKKQLPSLFFDFHFDGIGVNGSIYAAKAVDFNSHRQLSQIRSDISEFESVIERLKRIAEEKGLSNYDSNYCLIIDTYQGNQPSYNDLYTLLKKDNMPLFKILQSSEVEKFTNQVIKNNARKFSEELELFQL